MVTEYQIVGDQLTATDTWKDILSCVRAHAEHFMVGGIPYVSVWNPMLTV